MKLSVLDQSPMMAGTSPAQAIAETIALAKLADRLGYHRYWLAEHHSSSVLADPCPEILAARVAAETTRIRVGTGGVLLPYYSALKVAEVFRMLEALSPGRIDLGIGRAPGGDQRTAQAVAGGIYGHAADFPEQVADLVGFLDGTLPEDHPYAKVRANPAGDTSPEIWLLGSSDYSAALAANVGLRFAFADFIAPGDGDAVSRAYRRQFLPSARESKPVSAVAVAVVCAENSGLAERYAKVTDLRRLRRARGIGGPFPTLEEAEAYEYAPQEHAYVMQERARLTSGNPDEVHAKLLALGERFEADELIIITGTGDYASRRRSYELIAEVFELDTTPSKAASSKAETSA
jgi:luciferase family oxidoreductase group 1